MKFRVLTNDSGAIDCFLHIVQMISGLSKNCIFRITKQGMFFIIKERNVQGGAEAWCEVEQNSIFAQCICEGLSPEQDEILLEVIPEQILHCLRSGGTGPTSSSSNSSSNSMLSTAASGNMSRAPHQGGGGTQTTLHSLVMARSLKIKLVRRKTPCLALEVEQASISGRSRAVWHFVPVHILPPRLWSDFDEPSDPEFDLSIFLPPVKNLRLFVDRMKRFARFITIKANGAGDLYLEINMEALARVRLTFHGLRARDWHAEAPGVTAGDLSATAIDAPPFSATIDIRRFGQLLSSQRVQPNWFVCNIIQDHLIQFVLLFENSRLKYTLPASRL